MRYALGVRRCVIIRVKNKVKVNKARFKQTGTQYYYINESTETIAAHLFGVDAFEPVRVIYLKRIIYFIVKFYKFERYFDNF